MWKDNETEIDYLGFEYLVSTLIDTASNERLLPSCLGLYGDWGSGKSSLMNMCKSGIEAKDRDAECIIFNAWLFEGYEDAKTVILNTILDSIGKRRSLKDDAKKILHALKKNVNKLELATSAIKFGFDFATTGGLGTLVSNSVKQGLMKIGIVEDTDKLSELINLVKQDLNNDPLREDIKEFRSQFAELIEKSEISKLVVFIDELDRCNPDTVLETLEAIRLFLFKGKVSFIIGADERHISYAINRKFPEIKGKNMDIGKEYQEKIIQYPIQIPRLNIQETEFYIMCLLLEEKLEVEEFTKVYGHLKYERDKNPLDFTLTIDLISGYDNSIGKKVTREVLIAKELSGILSQGLNGNPRQCKRFLNTLYMRENMAKHKYSKQPLDRMVLSKIMLVEYFNPRLFVKMYSLQLEDKLQVQLKYLEENEMEKAKEFDLWFDDKWFVKWISIKPELASLDLKPYFYFMAEMLEERSYLNNIILSEKATSAIELLVNGSSTMAKDGIELLKTLSFGETSQVIENVYADMMKDDQIDQNKMKIFVDCFKINDEIIKSLPQYLESIEHEKLRLSIIPIIGALLLEDQVKQSIQTIFEKWRKINKNFDGAINAELKKLEGK